MKLTIGKSSELISKSQAIRHQVFVIEQNIPLELDLDGLDEQSYHAIVTNGGSSIGTARLCMVDGKRAVMGRVAVVKKHRGCKIATKIINGMIVYAREKNLDSIEIHAHKHLRDYYEKFGFEYIRNVEVVGEHQLIEMHCQL